MTSKFRALSFYAQSAEGPTAHDETFNDMIRAAERENISTCEWYGELASQYAR